MPPLAWGAGPLIAILDLEVSERAGWTLTDLASACLDGGARSLQVRVKRGSSAAFLDIASRIVALAHAAGAVVVVNDRADIARLCDADGVHVGQDDLSPVDVRRVVGPDAVVGLSTHTLSQLQEAVAEPVSYVAVGPVFGTATKDTGYDSIGLERVREAAGITAPRGLPLVAIGGITLANAPDVIQAGATTVAVISDLLATGDPAARVRAYLDRLSHV